MFLLPSSRVPGGGGGSFDEIDTCITDPRSVKAGRAAAGYAICDLNDLNVSIFSFMNSLIFLFCLLNFLLYFSIFCA